MPHAFDTKLAAPQRTLVQAGIVTLLSGLLAPVGYLASVIPWGGVVRSWTDVEGIDNLYKALAGQAPAIAVALGGRPSKPHGAGGFKNESELEVLLYFASNNARDLTSGRHLIDAAGAADVHSDPGLHVMLEHAEELLVGQRVGATTTIKQIRPDREEELTTRDDLTLWLQTYQVTLVRSINQNRTVTQMLNSIRWRTTQEDGEARLPFGKTKDTTLDVNHDNIPHP